MSLDPDRISRIVAILDQPELQDFEALVRLSGLDPSRAFCRANLTGVDFGRADLSGYDVSGADLSGANLSHARGLAGIKCDKPTKWPDGWYPPPPDLDLAEARRMILRGEAPPVTWRPFIQELSLRGETGFLNAAPLAALSALQSLNLSGTQVSDVAPLAALAALQSLNLMITQVSDVAPLAALTALRFLDLRGTQVSDVAPLAALTALEIRWTLREPKKSVAGRIFAELRRRA